MKQTNMEWQVSKMLPGKMSCTPYNPGRSMAWPTRVLVMSGIFSLISLLTMISLVWAEERRLTADEIHQLLANQKVVGKGFEQTFGDPRGYDSASTTYWEGNNQSLGRWRVQASKYCSVWNNPEYWACYEVFSEATADGIKVIWVDEGGRRFTGMVKKND